MNNKSNIPKLTPRISARPQPISDFLGRAVEGSQGGDSPRRGPAGYGLISSYPNRGSPHVLAAAGTVVSSSLGSKKKSGIPRPMSVSSISQGLSGRRVNEDNSSSSKSSGSALSKSPRRFPFRREEKASSLRSGRSLVTSTPRSGRDQLQPQTSSDVKSVTKSRMPHPQGIADNLTAHHIPNESTSTSTKKLLGQESLTTKFVLRKKSSPERSTDQRPPWSLTASDKQNEWKIKYGELVGVESPRAGKVKQRSIASLPQLVTSVASKPLEETKKSLLHLEALKNSLRKVCAKESFFAPLVQEPKRPAYRKSTPTPRSPRSFLKKVKEIEPRRIPVRREKAPPSPRFFSLPPIKSQKKRNFERRNKEMRILEKVMSKEGRRGTEKVERDKATRNRDKSPAIPDPSVIALDENETTIVAGSDEKGESSPNVKNNLEKDKDNKSTNTDGNNLNNEVIEGEKVTNNDTPEAESSQVKNHSTQGEILCKRCKNVESKERRRINDLTTENKSLTFMLGQKRSLVHSLQNQVKGILNDNQKMALRLLMSKKKIEKLERVVLRTKLPPEPPPPPPVTPVAAVPSTPAELEAKVNQLTHDLRTLQLTNEKNSSFLSNLLYTLSTIGYESLTDPSGNEIDLSKCYGDMTLEIKGRDQRRPKTSGSVGGGGGDSSHRPRKLASGQELMLKAVIGSQEEFIQRMSMQFQDLHRSNFIRGVVRDEEEVADIALDLLECSVRFCPSVMSVFEERLTVSPPKSCQAMTKILERLGTIRETKFTLTEPAVGLPTSVENKERTSRVTAREKRHHRRKARYRERMVRSSGSSGLDNQPSEEGRSRKCLEDDEEDCPSRRRDSSSKKDDVMGRSSGSSDEVPQETKELP